MSDTKQKLTKNFRALVEEKSLPVDSTQVQINSLRQFMAALGYLPVSQWEARGFVLAQGVRAISKDMKYISFNEAVKMHNAPYNTTEFAFNLSKAAEHKLVSRVKLRKVKPSIKHPLGIEVQNHWVQLV